MEHALDTYRSVHFVGIKGVAMTALAIYCKERGMRVTGSDVADAFPTDAELAKAGIHPAVGFAAVHIPKQCDLVVYTGAHGGRDNPEAVEARRRGIPTMAHGPALGMFMRGFTAVSVAGSHGKTTTTAMIATVLAVAGRDPSCCVGCGEVFGLGLPGHAGKGKAFVVEADEYITDPKHDSTPRFLWQHPEILVVTNIDYDHPDAYASLADVQAAFVRLQAQGVGIKLTVANADDPASAVLMSGGGEVVTYGMSPRADYRVTHIGFGQERTFFTLAERGIEAGEFTLKVPGRHNALNATAAAAACRALGLSWGEIRDGLIAFGGTRRRFERVGDVGGVTVYDDYAHHPHEIAATLAAARRWYPDRKIIAVFQPHTYSRTKALLADFAGAFADADVAVFADIYASARETDTLGITGKTLHDAATAKHKRALWAPTFDDCVRAVNDESREGAVVVFMGAGDIASWGKAFVSGTPPASAGGYAGVEAALGDRVRRDVPLAPYTTYKIGGPADLFIETESAEALAAAIAAARKNGVPFFLLGGGSNILVGDKGFRGLVIRHKAASIVMRGMAGMRKGATTAGTVFVEADAGVPFNTLVRYAIEHGLGGLEMHLGLPGSVGGAVAMNSKWGRPQAMVGDVVHAATILTPGGSFETVGREYFRFSYGMSSAQTSGDTIISVVFALTRGEPEALKAAADAAFAYRRATQPQGVASAGCAFKNLTQAVAFGTPTPNHTTSAGFLIDHAGLKGVSVGGAAVSETHANFIVNTGKASADDVVQLLRLIKEKVKERFGVDLVEEIKRVGEF